MPEHAYKYCKVERHEHLTVVTLNRPELLNALHYEADLELDQVWNDFACDPEQWIAILTGAGRAFSAGNDLKAQALIGGRRQFATSGFAGLTTRFDLDKPIVAAVNGLALGGGLELALACDLVILDEEAYVGLTEPRVGLAPLMGGAQYLPSMVGLHRAMGILLTGRKVAAREAYDMGFATAVAPAGESLSHARQWAEEMLICSPMALRAIKQTARKTLKPEHFEQMFATELPAVARLRASEDYREGPRAFAEKRMPRWTNQ